MITSAFVPVAKPAPSPSAPITIAAAAQRGAPALATAGRSSDVERDSDVEEGAHELDDEDGAAALDQHVDEEA